MEKSTMTLEKKLGEAIIEDGPYGVPKNWLWVKSLNLIDVIYGKNLSTKKLLEKGYPVFGANGYIGFYDRYLYDKEKVLISCRGAYSGSVNIAAPYSFITNNSLILSQKDARITNEFLKYLLISSNRDMLVSGTAQPQVTVKAFEEFYLPLPPLKEQQRIVNRIDSLFEKLNKAKELIEEAREGFEKRKSAVLEIAFSGNLTEKLIG
ncbi:restriction endonuclease subunit S [Clostridium sp.]|uniref:restriction endonuclease subunit S n=1 Tax=Clostridium sp. TaxID=1506 RepID=UPI0026113D17|nr:restriction endonuclease subunit S [Clostridium sp.]